MTPSEQATLSPATPRKLMFEDVNQFAKMRVADETGKPGYARITLIANEHTSEAGLQSFIDGLCDKSPWLAGNISQKTQGRTPEIRIVVPITPAPVANRETDLGKVLALLADEPAVISAAQLGKITELFPVVADHKVKQTRSGVLAIALDHPQFGMLRLWHDKENPERVQFELRSRALHRAVKPAGIEDFIALEDEDGNHVSFDDPRYPEVLRETLEHYDTEDLESDYGASTIDEIVKRHAGIIHDMQTEEAAADRATKEFRHNYASLFLASLKELDPAMSTQLKIQETGRYQSIMGTLSELPTALTDERSHMGVFLEQLTTFTFGRNEKDTANHIPILNEQETKRVLHYFPNIRMDDERTTTLDAAHRAKYDKAAKIADNLYLTEKKDCADMARELRSLSKMMKLHRNVTNVAQLQNALNIWADFFTNEVASHTQWPLYLSKEVSESFFGTLNQAVTEMKFIVRDEHIANAAEQTLKRMEARKYFNVMYAQAGWTQSV